MVFAADNAIDFLNKIVRWLLVMFPPCTLVRSFVKLGSIDVTVSKCDRICAETNCNREMLCEISPSCCGKCVAVFLAYFRIETNYTSVSYHRKSFVHLEREQRVQGFAVDVGNVHYCDDAFVVY